MADRDACRCRTFNYTGLLCNFSNTRVNRRFYFHTCSDYRSFCRKKRYCLTLHVGSHQCTVRIVILKERNQCSSHGEHLLRWYVHIIKFISFVILCLLTVTTGYVLINEMAFFIKRSICLCYMVIILFISSHVYNFICNDRIHRVRLVNLTVWSLNKTIFINSCVSCKRVNQTDVRTLGSLYRTHSSVVGIVYISNLESGSVSWQTARTQGG